MDFHNPIFLRVVSAVLGISLLSTTGTGKQDMMHHNGIIKNYAPAENAIVVDELVKQKEDL
jgi:hypothetical protein